MRAFENNTLLLIFSILCATVIWFIMMATRGENRATVVSNVPINIEVSEAAQEAGVRVFNSSAYTADVSITGNSLITNRVTPEELEVTATFDPLDLDAYGQFDAAGHADAARRQKRQHAGRV